MEWRRKKREPACNLLQRSNEEQRDQPTGKTGRFAPELVTESAKLAEAPIRRRLDRGEGRDHAPSVRRRSDSTALRRYSGRSANPWAHAPSLRPKPREAHVLPGSLRCTPSSESTARRRYSGRSKVTMATAATWPGASALSATQPRFSLPGG